MTFPVTVIERDDPRLRSSLVFLVLAVGSLVLFATGVGSRPEGLLWDRVFDVVLFSGPFLFAAVVCGLAAARVPTEGTAWRSLAVALVVCTAGNGVRTWNADPTGTGDYPVVADALSLAGYLTLYVTLVALIRVRVPRFHPSMWLDGIIGALGTMAVGVAFLLGPYLSGSGGRAPLPLVELAMPVTDLLLLALLVAVGSILGVRFDRTLLLVIAAMSCVLVGDVVQFARVVDGTYSNGGVLDLTWLVGICVVALAAHDARTRPAPTQDGDARSRVGWRLLALPLACNVASLVVLAVGWGDEMPVVAAWLAIGCVLAAIARTAVTFREVRSLNEVRQQARTDELSGLPNRRGLLEEAQRMVDDATAARPAALLLLDLDGFKEINDSLGHHAGDQLLRQVGPRLRDALGDGELLGRLGGDEFAVLLPRASLDVAQERAERLRELILQPFTVEDIRLHVGVSIGVATTPVPAATVAELLRCADVAMYAAKSSREGVHVYVPDPDGGTGDRLRTMEELRTALQSDQLVVHLQPQTSMADGRVVGAEALVRWQHPRRGLLSPADLLPAAEQAGLMRQLTDHVLELSLEAAARWWSTHRVPVSVNLSAANVTDLDLPGKVADALARHALPAGALTLELVEDTLMADPERGRTVLGQLRRLGIRTSIDDYGTGYSSLAYLRHLPADELKLDRSLTADVGADSRAAAIIEHTVALAHALGLRLVAEGVEDDATHRMLAELGCDIAQGYLIARPMPVADFLQWLEAPPHLTLPDPFTHVSGRDG
jgi:diguanylate cyclase (GGDEF)-like protein